LARRQNLFVKMRGRIARYPDVLDLRNGDPGEI
jgi:hypothetical protein